MLSHDLFEGDRARAALVSDIEVVEDFPARHDIAARASTAGCAATGSCCPGCRARPAGGPGAVSALGRWKMIDNLRRSLTAPLTLAALGAGWLLPMPGRVAWTAVVLALLALPYLLPLPFALLPGRAGITAHSHLAALARDARVAAARIALEITLLPDTAQRMIDAILRTGWRLLVSRRNLLEWMTAAHMSRRRRPGVLAQYRDMAPGVALGLVVAGGAAALNPAPGRWFCPSRCCGFSARCRVPGQPPQPPARDRPADAMPTPPGCG
jgi:cyclic beta-1,2-glucan synthetase